MEEPAEKIYRFWRDFRNLPTIMSNVESVTVESPTRSHWVVKGPLGTTVEWDAEIINDKPNPGYAFHTQPPGGLPEWYRQNVIGGPNAFLIVVEDFNSFADAMANKLAKEIDVARGAADQQVSWLNPAELP